MPALSQVPGELNVTITSGDEFSFEFTFTLNSVAVNLFGYSFESNLIVNKTNVPIAVEEVDVVNGKLNFRLTSAQTALIKVGIYSWYFAWIDTALAKRTVLSGSFEIKAKDKF